MMLDIIKKISSIWVCFLLLTTIGCKEKEVHESYKIICYTDTKQIEFRGKFFIHTETGGIYLFIDDKNSLHQEIVFAFSITD